MLPVNETIASEPSSSSSPSEELTPAPDSAPKKKSSKNSAEAYGAAGRTNLLMFLPEDLTIITDKEHPLYDERVSLPLAETFIANVDYHGVLEPIIVAKDSETGKTVVVDGRQRVRAALEVNKRRKKRGEDAITVKATIQRGSGEHLMGVMISTNELRMDDEPLVRAQKMVRYLNMGQDTKQVALIFGVTQQTVKNHVALIEAPAAVQKAVEKGTISASTGYELAKLPAEEAKAELVKVLAASNGETKGPGKRAKRGRQKAQDKARGRVVLRTKAEVETLMKSGIGNEVLDPIVTQLCKWFLGSDRALKSLSEK